MIDHAIKGYIFTSSERRVQIRLELESQLKTGSILNATIYLIGTSICVIKPNNQLVILE
jgi:hypothetical protein